MAPVKNNWDINTFKSFNYLSKPCWTGDLVTVFEFQSETDYLLKKWHMIYIKSANDSETVILNFP